MRDLAITGLFLFFLPQVFRHAYIGVLLWTWISVMNPHRLTWGFAYDLPFAAAAAGATFIALMTTKDKVSMPRSGIVTVLIIFILWMCVTTAFGFFPGESLDQLKKVMKIQVMTLVALAVLQDKKHIQLFVWINVLSIGFFGLKGGVYTIMTGGGGRVWGPGGFIGGNNEIGLAMLITIPLMYYLTLTNDNKWIKRGLFVMMLMTTVAVLGTQSRGAFLAIVAMGGILWLRSRGKIVSGVVIMVAAAGLFAFMPQSWHDRMSTIETYEEDTSAMGRINAWQTAVNLANDRVTGGGFEMYEPIVYQSYAPDPRIVRAAHSIYFQVLGEHGWPGLFLYLLLGWLSWREAVKLRRQTRDNPEHEWVFHLAGMIQVVLIGFGVGGAFLSLAYFDLPYNVMVMLVVTRRWLENERKKANETVPTGREVLA